MNNNSLPFKNKISQTRIKSRIYAITSITIQGKGLLSHWESIDPWFSMTLHQWSNKKIKTAYHTVCKTCSPCHFHCGNIKKDEKGPKGIMTNSAPKLFRIKELRYCCTND